MSNLDDLSHWAAALLNNGRYAGKQVLPADVLHETLTPSIALPNTSLESRGWGEMLNARYGLGRQVGDYRGHLLALHGGDLPGFHSQVAILPQDGFAIVVLVIGDHAAPLYNYLTYHLTEKLLGMSETPWSQRGLDIRLKNKAAGTAARQKAGSGRVANTHPSHPLDDYTGQFVHPAYGVLRIDREGEGLRFTRDLISLPLTHFHYDRFDSPDDEEDGLWSLNFMTGSSGEVDRVVLSLDEAEVTFTRRTDPALSEPKLLETYAATYVTPGGSTSQVAYNRTANALELVSPGSPVIHLVPWKDRKFHLREFSDTSVEFVLADGKVTGLKVTDPSSEIVYPKK